MIDQQKYHVYIVDAAYLNTTSWETRTCLLVIPGGRSLPYYQALGHVGNQRIRAYVENGGNYLGICAGAYYGAARTLFAMGTENEVDVTGPLNFYSGMAQGPTYPLPFDYDSDSGVGPAKLAVEGIDQAVTVYFNGGCYFKDTTNSIQHSVLARYIDLENQLPAIVMCNVGKGKAILSGVHFEVSPQSRLFHKNRQHTLAQQIIRTDHLRQQLFAKLLAVFNILTFF